MFFVAEKDITEKILEAYNNGFAGIGLENQTEADPDMPLRVLGLDGAEYRAELLRENNGQRYPVNTGTVLWLQKPWG